MLVFLGRGGQAKYTSDKVIADYHPDVDNKPEESDSDIEAVDEKEKNSDVEYAKMMLPWNGTLH